jgi:hypothetical protein
MTLAEEAQRYLAAVEVFRREGCEPHWRPERTVAPVPVSPEPTVQAATKTRSS